MFQFNKCQELISNRITIYCNSFELHCKYSLLSSWVYFHHKGNNKQFYALRILMVLSMISSTHCFLVFLFIDNRKNWSCSHCNAPYSSSRIEQLLIHRVQKQSMAFILQDVSCVKCKLVSDFLCHPFLPKRWHWFGLRIWVVIRFLLQCQVFKLVN